MRAHGPRVVVGWNDRSALALALVAPPAVRVHSHNDLPVRRGHAALLRLAARRADRVVALSATLAAHLGDGVTVIHPGVDETAFAPPASPPVGPPTLAVLGAILDWKRPDVALEVAARLPEVRLVLAGGARDAEAEELLARLRERAERPDLAGRVEFTGRLEDPRRVLHAAHALLHPAERESFGVAVAEAMACGLPVAAADAGALPEVTAPDTAVLFAPGDVEAATRAMRDALARPELGAAGRARVEAGFTAGRARVAWGELLRGL